MGQLTVKEKEHWKERIGRKVNQLIERLIAESDPSYRERIAKQAATMATESLGIADLLRRTRDIEVEQKRLEAEMLETLRKAASKVGWKDDAAASNWDCERIVSKAKTLRQAVHEQELMSQDSIGQQILSLEKEKEELLDTVWLATSGSQIKELWGRVAEMLQQHPTELQKAALALSPVEDS